MGLDRAALQPVESGAQWCRAYCAQVDTWLRSLLAEAGGTDAPVALVAIGGYGRGDLCPHSDIDVMLLHRKGADVSGMAERLWYPIWDEGVHLGHSVRTIDQALDLAGDDLDTATALLSARLVAGDAPLVEDLRTAALRQWQAQSKKWLTRLSMRVQERHANGHEVAFAMEPDLKDGRGGLRDIQSLRWADAARPLILDEDRSVLADAYETLLRIRVGLHLRTDRPTNVLVLEDREAVARAAGFDDPDVLMATIAETGRAVAWRSDDAWRRISLALRGPLGRLKRRTRSLGGGIELRDGEVQVTPASLGDRLAVLRAAHAAASEGATLAREALAALAAAPHPVEPWSDEARELLVALLRCGRRAIPVIEALDQVGVWSRDVLPEWRAVHAQPQHNPFHRYTVDRHLLETAAVAAKLAADVERRDLLVLGALLHDLGKGLPGDHSEAGVALASELGARWLLPEHDVRVLESLVRHHLLLTDVATRRDLDDPASARRVADVVGDRQLLHLLAALTEADARATGPAAWTAWRAELVRTLVQQVDEVLATGGAPAPRGLARLDELDASTDRVEVDGNTVTVVTDDRPGTFSRIAGALALHGLEVLAANAQSTDDGRALSGFVVDDPMSRDLAWDRVTRDVRLALDGRLALDARLAERGARYRRDIARLVSDVEVAFDDDASSDATVIDVHTADAIGVLYRITRALAELDLDIRSAKVQTVGADVVDAFYVVDRSGSKITDPAFRTEITRAIRHALGG